MRAIVNDIGGIIHSKKQDYAPLIVGNMSYNYFIANEIDKNKVLDLKVGDTIDYEDKRENGFNTILSFSKIEFKEFPSTTPLKQGDTFTEVPPIVKDEQPLGHRDTATVVDYKTKEGKKYLKGMALNISGNYFAHANIMDEVKMLEYAKRIYARALVDGFLNW